MQHHAQSDRRSAALKGTAADQAAGDVLKYHLRRDPSEQVEDEIIGDVQGPGDQADPQNGRQSAGLL